MKKIAKYEMMAGVLVAILLLVLPSAGRAATITWGSATTDSADSDIITAGTLVYAYNVGPSSGSVTINGVTFTDAATTGLNGGWTAFGTGTFGTAAGLSTNYQTLLSSAAFNTGSKTLTLSGLTSGDSYEFQFWVDDSRNATNRTESLTAGNSVTLSFNTTNGTGGVGQFAVGTFVADSTSETITITSVFDSTHNNVIQANGYELRDITVVPEPKTAILMLLSISLGILWMRRRHNAV